MGEVREGDTLFDEHGRLTTITRVFDINHAPVLYRMSFSDGSTIDACEDHEWLTFDAAELVALLRQSRQELPHPDGLLQRLQAQCALRAPLFEPRAEQAALRAVIEELLP